MSKVHICRQHELDQDRCRDVAEQLLDKLINKFGGSISEEGEDYRYNHPTGIKAKVEPRAGEITIDVKLGMMTRSLAPKLDEAINRVLDEYIGEA